jgi:hypothetical protein
LAALISTSRPAFASDTLNWGDANHENKLRWLPYRPEHNDADAKTADDNTAQCKKSSCTSGACKQADYHCSGSAQCSGGTVQRVEVHQPAAEASRLNSKVRLATAEEENAAPVLNDPFEDNHPSSGYQHPISITPEDVDSAPAQHEPTTRQPQRVAQRVPPEPRELPGQSVQVYQSRPPATPGPDSYQPAPAEQLPDMEGTRQALQNPAEDCRTAYDKLRGNTLDKVSIDITVNGKQGDDIPYECALTTDQFVPRCWEETCYTWKASSLCHKPLYFEEEGLERYGHSMGWIAEDFVSCAHFFGNVALLPYHVGVETPCECIYDLGVYRVGDCAPYICDPFPISLRGCCTAAVGYGATIALFP